MSKYNLNWDENKLKKYISEGRSQGVGKDYKPWITIHDFPSEGFSSRQPGWKFNRVCHFLSNNELRYFYSLEWADNVTDIREQYPMKLEDTLKIAEQLGIKHPINTKNDVPYVMSSDFMITMSVNGKETDIEQYPIFTFKQTMAISEELGIEHPKESFTGENVIMTTDFVITIEKKGEPLQVARTIKSPEELDEY